MCRGRSGGGAAGLGLPALALMSPVTRLPVTPGWVTGVRGRPPVRVGHLLRQLRTQGDLLVTPDNVVTLSIP